MSLRSFASYLNVNFKSDVVLYCLLFNFFILVNKYVLSTIGFKFPAVFQGWQTLVSSAYLFRLKHQVPNFSHPESKCHQICDALIFVAVIVTGSKALSAVPIPLFLCIQNVPMLCYLILSLYKVPLTEFFIAITGLSSALFLFIFKDDNLSDDGVFWLIWHCIMAMIFETCFQNDDSIHKEIIKNFYRNILSVGVLLLWVIFTEEGELASKFTPSENAWFITACISSGIFCAIIHSFGARSRFAHGNLAQAISRIPPLFLSLFLFPNDHLSFKSWNLIALNVICSVLLSASLPRQSNNSDSTPIPV